MKKKIVVLLIVFWCFISHVQGLDKAHVDWELDKGTFAHQVRNGSEHVTNLAVMNADGVVAYCVEPGVLADKDSLYDVALDVSQTPLGSIDVKKISLIGYYGYGYHNHDDKKYYMAAQELIWRERGVEDVWWTDAKTEGNVINIDEYKNEIMSLVSHHETVPKFDFKNKYLVGDEVELQDKNSVLNGYYVVGDKSNVTINDNKVKIKVLEGDNTFTLARKKNGKVAKFYYKSGYQTIGSFEYAYDVEKTYKIDSVTGRIIVDKLDNDTKSKTSLSYLASLAGASYAIYDADDKLIEQKKTDAFGRIIFDGLPKGNYTIKELKSSNGYGVSETIHRTFLASSQIETTIKSYEAVIKNKIIITKVLEDNENGVCVFEPGILFHVYDETGKLYREVVTDENGVVSFELPFGNYVLKQITSPAGISKVNDTKIMVNKANETKKLVLVNKKIKTEKPVILPNTGKHEGPGLMLMLNCLLIIGVLNEKKYF